MLTRGLLCLVWLAPMVRSTCDDPAGCWRLPPESAKAHRCDFRRVKLSDPDALEQLESPAIIEGAVQHWAAMKAWSSRAEFVRKFGDVEMASRSILHVPLDTAQDGVNRGKPRTDTNTLNEVMRNGRMPYIFERETAEFSLAPQLLAELQPDETSPQSAVVEFPMRPPLRGFRELVFSMGGPEQGLPPHKHTAAWLGLVLGQKEWSVMPPSGLASRELYFSTALRSAGEWSNEHIARLKKEAGLQQCVQHPGDVIFVPHLWWHATVNFGDAIGMGAQATGLDALPTVRLDISGCALATSLLARVESGEQSKARIKRAFDLEPLSVKHVLAYAEQLILSPTPGMCLLMMKLTRKEVEAAVAKKHIRPEDAHQFIGRLGQWLDRLPDRKDIRVCGSPSSIHLLSMRCGRCNRRSFQHMRS